MPSFVPSWLSALPSAFVEDDGRGDACIERLDPVAMRDPDAQIGLRKQFSRNPYSLVADDDRQRAGEVGLIQRRAFVR